jgi:transposase
MSPESYFSIPGSAQHKKYEALRAFFYEKKDAETVAELFGFTVSTVYSMTRDFRNHLNQNGGPDYFFKVVAKGRRLKTHIEDIDHIIISMRKQNFSAENITAALQAKGQKISYGYVYSLLRKEGFSRLHRRSIGEKQQLSAPKIEAPLAELIEIKDEKFDSNNAGILCLLPIIRKYGIDKQIEKSDYPETKAIGKTASILSFLALKLSNIRRYSCDDLWCMDRGPGLFAGLNVLPKTAWLSSYSHRVTARMNRSFLAGLHRLWSSNDLLGDTSNLDFTTIPCWGDGRHLENNWSGKRGKALSSILAVLAQDADCGIIDYGNADVLHKDESAVVLEYLDFYHANSTGKSLNYLVFDSKFTNYQNLAKLNKQDVKFITIRRRGKNLINQIKDIPKQQWKRIRVEASGLKKRSLKVCDQTITLRGYIADKSQEPGKVRQVIITGHGKIKPAFIITNDFDISMQDVVRKYSRRWLVEKSISEQIDFFHLNRLSSSMVIKVDFDLTMSILAHNIYRLFALETERYQSFSDVKLFEKFFNNSAKVQIESNQITVALKKKRELPQLLTILEQTPENEIPWLGNCQLNFIGYAST